MFVLSWITQTYLSLATEYSFFFQPSHVWNILYDLFEQLLLREKSKKGDELKRSYVLKSGPFLIKPKIICKILAIIIIIISAHIIGAL